MHYKTGLLTRTAVSVFLAASVVMAGCAGPKTVSAPSGQGTEVSSDSAVENTTAKEEVAEDEGIVEDILEDTDTSSPAETADPGATGATASASEYATEESAAAAASTGSTADLAVAADTGSTEAAAVDSTSAAASTNDAADQDSSDDESKDDASSEIPAADAGVNADDSVSDGSAEDEDDSSIGMWDMVPSRENAGEDTALLESELSKALVKCTGWGQSAGSSLSAGLAATELITWSGKANAGSADADTLKKVIQEEVERFTPDQQDLMKGNWPFIRYDAENIFDDFDSMSGLLDDAGCLAAAKEATSAPDAEKNWKAASDAFNAVLR